MLRCLEMLIRKLTNTGTITLESPAGTTPNKSAAIYSLVDGGTGTGILTTENNETINVDQKDSVGIFAQNNGAGYTAQNAGKDYFRKRRWNIS